MKRLLAAIVTLFFCSSHAVAEEGAEWATAMATRPSDGHRIIYRYRSAFGPSFKRAQFPDRVTITWPYTSENGMPSTTERESMDQLEDRLDPYVEQTSLSALVMVSTGEGLREWVYYTRSQTEFMAKLNEALRGMQQLPIKIDLWKDPTWKRYEAFRSSVRN